MGQLLQLQDRKPADDRARFIERQHKQNWYHDRSAKDLMPLEKGDAVHMKPLRPGEKEWRKALVVDRHDQRSYTMATSDGGTYRRNCVHLRKTQAPPPIIQQDHWKHWNTSCKHSADEDARQNRQSQAAGNQREPEPVAERPSRVRRPPERLKDYVFFSMYGVKLIAELFHLANFIIIFSLSLFSFQNGKDFTICY